MQTEEAIGSPAFVSIVEPSNGEDAGYHSNALEARAGDSDYPFDAGTLHVEVPHGENIVTIKYSKPELKDYLARQSALNSKSRIVGGAIVGGDVKHDADTDFFDTVVLSATKRKKTGIKVEKEYDQAACRRFPFELKVKAVKRMTTSRFKVEADGDELSDEPTELTVTQTIGDVPDYTIVYKMKSLSEKHRTAYMNAAQTRSKIKNGDTIIESEPHYIEKALKLFGGKDAHLISLTGGRLDRGPFSEEWKFEFIAQIDPLFQVGVIDAICEYYGGGQD